ncbi:hypothetical protein BJ322DRAFT_1004557 [Thelephora terrestris]|uniref:Exosome complex protein n=1 Tax=Thelephora terrestris TaxID=56493 RepID=A0A9P6HFG1_9AGAM|nr:hypothetical protein BJ322DRAFT_1004557 [Thelephora terrestris]
MSATDTNKLRARVATLDKLLDDFDGQLDDLLAKSLPETLLGLDTLQQAKLQVTIPYLVYDLVIIYLKTKGIDPRTHSVFRELERVKEYIEKVSKAEKQESQQQRTAIDKAAANRFIKHAIAQAVRTQGQTSEPTDQEPTPGPSKIHVQAQSVPAGATKKMLARAEWEKQVQVAAEEEEEDLEIFEEAEGQAIADADVEMTDDKASAPPLPMRAGETGVLSEQQSGMCIS